MKRIFALALALALICTVFCACGDKKKNSNATVSTSVAAKYDEGYAKKYAKSTSTDSNGNTVYEFSEDKYKEFTTNYNNHLSSEMSKEIVETHVNTADQKKKNPYGQYVYINEEKQAVIVGLMPGQYKEAQAKEEADLASEYGFKYFQNLQNPVNSFKVLFVNANNQDEIYGSFDYSI